MKIFKRLLLAAAVTGACVFLGLQSAYWAALSGYFACSEGGCGILAELVLWPLLTIAYLLIAGVIVWLRRRSRNTA